MDSARQGSAFDGIMRTSYDTITLRNELGNCSSDDKAKRVEICWKLSCSLFQAKSGVDASERQPPTDAELDEAVARAQEAFDLLSGKEDDTLVVCHVLAGARVARFGRKGNLADLSMATRVQEQIYKIVRGRDLATCAMRIPVTAALAGSYDLWVDQAGRTELLDAIVGLNREMLGFYTADEPEWPVAASNLAAALQKEYNHTNNSERLNEAITLNEEALYHMTSQHTARASVCTNLASVLYARLRQTDDPEPLEAIRSLLEEALQLQPLHHPEHWSACAAFAGILKISYEYTEDLQYLERAIELERATLAAKPRDDSDRNDVLLALVDILGVHASKKWDQVIFDEAISLNQDILETVQLDMYTRFRAHLNMANLYFSPTSPQFNADLALNHLREACAHISILLLPRTSVFESVARFLADIDMDNIPSHLLPDFLAIYVKIIDVVPLFVGLSLSDQAESQPIRQIEALGCHASLCAVRTNDIDRGLELLECARGALWSRALSLSDPLWNKVPDELVTEIQELMEVLASRNHSELGSGRPKIDNHRHLRQEWLLQLVDKVRTLSGLERFMLGPTCHQLKMAASSSIVVVIWGAQGGCHAAIIRSPEADVEYVSLGTVTLEELNTIAEEIRSFGYPGRTPAKGTFASPELVGRDSLMHGITRILARLWFGLVRPVFNVLGLEKKNGTQRPRLHWCLSGELASMPVHAAGIYEGELQEGCSDYVVSSYTPSLSTLMNAQLTKVKNYETHKEHRILFVPDTSSEPLDEGRPRLNSNEMELVSRIAADASLHIYTADNISSPGSLPSVLESLPQADIVHFACCGTEDATSPLDSGFHLRDGLLTVSQVVSLNIKNAFLAFMCARKTVDGDMDSSSEPIHLGTAMLFAGFNNVITDLWNTDDMDVAVVAQVVYKSIVAQKTLSSDAIAYALDEAVQQLRGKGVPPYRWGTFVHMGA